MLSAERQPQSYPRWCAWSVYLNPLLCQGWILFATEKFTTRYESVGSSSYLEKQKRVDNWLERISAFVLLVFSPFVYQLFRSMFLQGLRRRYGDSSLQAEGAVQYLKDAIPMVTILWFFLSFCFVCLFVFFWFGLVCSSISLLVWWIATVINKGLGPNLHLRHFCSHATPRHEYNFTCLASPPPTPHTMLKTSTYNFS